MGRPVLVLEVVSHTDEFDCLVDVGTLTSSNGALTSSTLTGGSFTSTLAGFH